MEQRTELTQIHGKIIEALDFLGLDHKDEEPVEINGEEFQLDCYLPVLHACIEADGPSHGMRGKKDRRRDDLLLSIGMPTLRLRWKMIEAESPAMLAHRIAVWLGRYLTDVAERRALAKAKETIKRVPKPGCECPGDCPIHDDIGGL